MTPKLYGTLWHPNMYPHSICGIPTLKQYKLYNLDTIFLEPGSEDKVKITVTQKQYAKLCDPKVYPHTNFGIPVSNYITDMLRSRFRFRLTDGQIVSCVSSLHGAHHQLWLQKSAEPSAVNVNQICMKECTYDAVGCAYLILCRTTSCPGVLIEIKGGRL